MLLWRILLLITLLHLLGTMCLSHTSCPTDRLGHQCTWYLGIGTHLDLLRHLLLLNTWLIVRLLHLLLQLTQLIVFLKALMKLFFPLFQVLQLLQHRLGSSLFWSLSLVHLGGRCWPISWHSKAIFGCQALVLWVVFGNMMDNRFNQLGSFD